MGIQYSAQEREALEARARAILDECPDVLRLIARGAALAGPDHEALVYLRTAMDPAPAVTTARDFLGLLIAAGRWFRANGVGPEDTVSIFVPHCTAMAIAYWAAMSFATVHPLNLLFSREAIVAQLKAARAKILFAPPPGAPGGLFEKVEGLVGAVPTLERVIPIPLDGSVAFGEDVLRPDFGFRDNSPAGGAAEKVVALLPTGGTTGAPKAGRTHQPQCDRLRRRLDAGIRPHARRPLSGRIAALSCRGRVLRLSFGPGRRRDDHCSDRRGPPQPRRRRQLLAHRGGATRDGRRPRPDRTRPPGRRNASRRHRHFAAGDCFATGGTICPPEIERRVLAVWPGDCLRQLNGMTECAGRDHQDAARSRPETRLGQRSSRACRKLAVLAGGSLHRDGPSPTGEIVTRGPQVFVGYADGREGAFHEAGCAAAISDASAPTAKSM